MVFVKIDEKYIKNEMAFSILVWEMWNLVQTGPRQ